MITWSACSVASEDVQHEQDCKELNNLGMKCFVNYQMDNSRLLSLDSALTIIDRAIGCDTNYYLALHNKFTILYETKQFRYCIPVLQKLQLKSSTPVPLLIANEALCNYFIGNIAEFERLRTVAIRQSEKRAEYQPDEQNAGQVLMIRAMLNGHDDALQYLAMLKDQGFTAIDYDLYDKLIREMPGVDARESPKFDVAPAPK